MTGIKVAPFNTTQGRRNRFQLNFRNHRKVVVVDGEVAWIGGHNVGVEYLGQSKRFGHWRDTHVRLAGPAVLGAEVAFATDWQWATRTLMDIDWDTSPRAQGNSEVLVFPSDPASEYEEAGLMYHQSIVAARERLWIASPYFVPDNAIISALQLAALRGVDVRVLIPDEPDGRVVGMANWSFTRQLLPLGVRVYRYQGGFMHQKVMLVDSEACGIGTANFDNRSFRLNFEITVLVQDTGFAREVESMLEADIARCREVSLQELKDKPLWFALAMSAARLLAPVL
jgi:cardiolipin synthase